MGVPSGIRTRVNAQEAHAARSFPHVKPDLEAATSTCKPAKPREVDETRTKPANPRAAMLGHLAEGRWWTLRRSGRGAAVHRARGKGAVIPIVEVKASRGKAVRADPVSTLYRHHQVHHVQMLPKLEQEITEWSPTGRKRSRNRLDALVWAVYHLAALGEDPPPDPAHAFKGLRDANAWLTEDVRWPMPGDRYDERLRAKAA
jgi:hypothetical protein